MWIGQMFVTNEGFRSAWKSVVENNCLLLNSGSAISMSVLLEYDAIRTIVEGKNNAGEKRNKLFVKC